MSEPGITRVQPRSRPAALAARRGSAHRWGRHATGCALSLALCGAALGDTLSSESSIGLSSEYNSNPFLLPSGSHAAESVALLANLPATYASDMVSVDLVPRLRLAKTHGDATLLSNYEYLDSALHLNSERNRFTASADWHHDSSLYYQFENAAVRGRSLPRLEESAALDWKRDLNERTDLHFLGSWDKVAYSQNTGTGLLSYSYSQGLVQYDRALSERWQWMSSVGFGRYQQLDHSYRSDDRFVQTALKWMLSERWSMTAQAGYSNLSGPSKPSTSRGSGNYALSLERKSERLVLDLAASRAIVPSGLGALLTQDDLALKASIPWTERLTLAATLHGSRIADSLNQLNLGNRRYADADLSADWLWTEHWKLHLLGSYYRQGLNSGGSVGSGTAVYLNLLRQFGRIPL